jgi:hypothetical protein
MCSGAAAARAAETLVSASCGSLIVKAGVALAYQAGATPGKQAAVIESLGREFGAVSAART